MSCLDNDSGNYVTIPSDFPGTYLDYDEQCQMLYGTQADGNCNQNKKADFSCERIYCREDPDNKPNLCTDYYPPAEGTPCNTEDNDEGEAYDGWCRIGECLIEGEEPTIDEGEWSDWEEGECSVTCGGGVKLLTRTCNVNDGEEYCKGSDTMYELCNTQLCDGVCSDINADNYRNQFCSSGKAKFYGGDNLCNLYCGSNYEMKVLDGGRQTDDPGKVADLDICIDGQPFTVGCDGSFTSGLVYDRCGVCDGDNSTCTFIDSSFSDISNFSDKELVPIAELIAGTTHITFVESEYVQSAYFVLRTSDGTYLTNSDYTIRPGYTNTGDAGPFRYDPDCNTIFTHNHPYKEVEKIVAPGPISETIDVLYYVKKTSKFQPILFSYYTPTGETDTDDVTQTDQEDADDFANGSQNEDNEVDNNEQEEENDNENELNSAEEENEVEGEAGETGDAEAEDEEGYAEGEAGGEVETEGEAGTEAEEDEDAEEGTEEGEEGEVEEEGTEEGEGDAEEGTEEEEEVEEEEEEEGEAEGEAEEEEAEEGTEEEEEEEEEGEAEQNQDDNNGASCTDMTYVRGMAENQEQCDAKKGKRGAYDWVYKLRANEPCKFYCYSEEKEELALFNGGIAEGSWCSNDVLQPKRCIEGDCVDVGCDGEGGGLEFDNCGVCGGNGDTCQLVQASVQLSEDITSITTFPIGASHIYVSERNSNGPKYAKGYYILETSTGSYVTGSNEDGTASEPADKSSAYYYEVGCTAFKHYKWTYESETIESDMPLTEAVELKYQYIDQKSDRFVQYEYYIP
ncbi:ADAMTS-like protein 2 [Anneissia japonica]|uniref:ADAMTS-like protein 2 n=1 Tax=Anneissia japonica TaxID=1529436 RepID=UPI0014257CA0|nr:ADAMTS-like protein 2 [Anneissia japonica]